MCAFVNNRPRENPRNCLWAYVTDSHRMSACALKIAYKRLNMKLQTHKVRWTRALNDSTWSFKHTKSMLGSRCQEDINDSIYNRTRAKEWLSIMTSAPEVYEVNALIAPYMRATASYLTPSQDSSYQQRSGNSSFRSKAYAYSNYNLRSKRRVVRVTLLRSGGHQEGWDTRHK